jgi:cobalt-zinc-cadmium resistance protein CzcA
VSARLVEGSLRHPFLVLVGAALVVVAGTAAVVELPIDAVPDITTVQVQILTRAPALGPLEVEQLITRPVEDAMGGLPRLAQLRSVSRYGISAVTAVFEDGTDLYLARQLVAERLAVAQEEIPAGVERPEMGPPSTGLGEIFHFVVEGEGRSLMELRSLLDWEVVPRLRHVPGVAEVNAVGGEVRQYQVVVDPARLAARGVTLPQVFEAVARNNADRGGGVIEKAGEAYVVRGRGRIETTADLEQIVVPTPGGGVPLAELGEARVGAQLRVGGVTRDGKGEAVMGTVMMVAGSNAREVVGRVKEAIAELGPSLPEGVRVVPVYDRQALVSRVIHTVSTNLVEGGLLVVAVLLLLLGHLRGGLIVASAIPLSMLAAFLGMTRAGVSGNLMSLGAIDFGLIVDGSVVMVENIVRHLSESPGRDRAARHERILAAAREVARPVAFGVGIILLVYVPVLTLGGVEGKMFRPMALTVVFALAASLVLALTLVPVLCALVFRGPVAERETALLKAARRLHRPALEWSMRRPLATVLLAASVFVLALGGARRLGAEFVPRLDEGDLVIRPFRLPSVSLTEALSAATRVEKVLLRFPEVESVTTRTGSPDLATEPVGFDSGDAFISLRPRSQWRSGLDHDRLVAAMREALDREAPGTGVASFSQPIEDRFEELVAGVRADVGVKLFGDDLEVLAGQADEIATLLRGIPGAVDVRVEQTAGQPTLELRVDRERAARLGTSVDDVLAVAEAVRAGRTVGSVFEGRRRRDIVVRLPDGVGAEPGALAAVPVAVAAGGVVPLSHVASLAVGEGPAQVSREAARRRILVEANVEGRDLAGFVAEAERVLAGGLHLPPGYYLEWGGQFEHLVSATRRLLVAVPLALLLIFVLLYQLFASLRPAVLIFLNVPMAATGGIFALLLRGLPFSISAGVGFIALFGVAVLNGIVLVSFVRSLRGQGLSPLAAARRAAEARLRPILMTALVASLGFVPMALATGSGAEVQRPLATVVIGGLITSTLLTLLVLPTAYRWFAGEEDADVV